MQDVNGAMCESNSTIMQTVDWDFQATVIEEADRNEM